MPNVVAFDFFLKNVSSSLRQKLENVEAEHRACLQALEKEQARVQELQEDLQQQRLIDQQTVEQNHQTQEVKHSFDALTLYWWLLFRLNNFANMLWLFLFYVSSH